MSPAAKRTTARSLVMLPLLLCVFAWAWSYLYTERLSYSGSRRDWSVQIAIGELHLWSGAAMRGDSGWRYVHMHPDWEFGELYNGLPHRSFLGAHVFSGAHPYSPGVSAVLLVAPLWMLSVAAGLAPALLWWRARKRRSVGGFPIEGTEPRA